MTKFELVDSNGVKYVDPFTGKTAKFDDEKTAKMTLFMLFSQQDRIFEVKKC